MISKDTLWKGVIEEFAPDVVKFAFPQYEHLFDLNRKIEFLDAFLASIRLESESKNRVADKLLKVFLKDGTSMCLLVRLESQDDTDKDFARKMFLYYCRILDTFKESVTLLVIYTGRNKSGQINEYRTDSHSPKVYFRFNKLSLIDHKPEFFRSSGNAFGFVLEAARRALEPVSKDEDDRIILASKIDMMRYYLSSGLAPEKIRVIYDFVNHYQHFKNPESSRIFEQKFGEIIPNNSYSGVRAAILEEVEQKGIEKGQLMAIQSCVVNAYKNGMDAAEIATIVSLLEADVQKIIDKING